VRPIVKRLGLRVADRDPARLAGMSESVDAVDCLPPVYAEADVDLVDVARLCWRRRDRTWRLDDGRPLGTDDGVLPRYSAALGPSSAAFLEPQPDEPLLDAKVMMLLADREAVAAHLAAALPPACPFRLTPLGTGPSAALRLFARRSRAPAVREAEELVWLDGHYLSLSLPVEISLGDRTLRALFALADFTDNGFFLQAVRELTRAPVAMAAFDTSGADWFGSTDRCVRLLRLRAAAIERTAEAARLTPQPVLDVFAVRDEPGPADPSAEALDEVWDFVAGLQPVLALGRIAHVRDDRGPAVQRLTLTSVEDHEPCPGAAPVAAGRWLARFHASETFPWFDALRLQEAAIDARLAVEMDDGDVGRTRVVAAVRVAEYTVREKLRRMELLWEA
jgi:hypothetical protein